MPSGSAPSGSRHSFTDLADTDGRAGVAGRPAVRDPVVDEAARTVTVGAGQDYGAVAVGARASAAGRWPTSRRCRTSASAGAVATGTHGSGDRLGSLASAVAAIELVGADGELRTVARGDAGFEGSVVALGALGVVTRLTLDVEPTYPMRQDVYTGLPWRRGRAEFDAITSAADSVSLFTRLDDRGVLQAWCKSRSADAPATCSGRRARPGRCTCSTAPRPSRSPTRAAPPGRGSNASRTSVASSPRAAGRSCRASTSSTASRGTGRPRGPARLCEPRLRPVLQNVEIRTVAADELWLSSSYRRPTVGFHFTWLLDEPAVYAVLPAIEAALLPLGARPHWGKCFVGHGRRAGTALPAVGGLPAGCGRAADPDGKFGNAFLDRVLG